MGDSSNPNSKSANTQVDQKVGKDNKVKKKGKGPKAIPHKDQYQRISFLYQAANALSYDQNTEALGRMYAQTMKVTARKTVLRL